MIQEHSSQEHSRVDPTYPSNQPDRRDVVLLVGVERSPAHHGLDLLHVPDRHVCHQRVSKSEESYSQVAGVVGGGVEGFEVGGGEEEEGSDDHDTASYYALCVL